jgi:hypothetical protein
MCDIVSALHGYTNAEVLRTAAMGAAVSCGSLLAPCLLSHAADMLGILQVRFSGEGGGSQPTMCTATYGCIMRRNGLW